MRTAAIGILALASLLLPARQASLAQDIEFGLPVRCELGRTCFVQNYFDVDPSPAARDFTCGDAAYDGHDAVDIRVLSLEAASKGVEVIAAAPGTVRGLRDGEPERLVETDADRSAVANRECGNGVVLSHKAGIETQYCHMKRGSVRVKNGDRVEAGAVLGEIGASGLAQFPHVHFEIRIDGRPVDPFTGLAAGGACNIDNRAKGRWSEEARAKLGRPETIILETGFAEGQVESSALEIGRGEVPSPTTASPGLVFFARLMNLRTGDRLKMSATGPEGFDVSHESEPLERSKARYVTIIGKRRKAPSWPAGTYRGKVELIRNGAVAKTATGEIDLR